MMSTALASVRPSSYVSQTAHARYSRDICGSEFAGFKIGCCWNGSREKQKVQSNVLFRDHSFNIIFTFQLWVTEHTHLLSQRKKRMVVQIFESVLCRCRRKSSEEKLPTMSEDVCRRRKVAEDSEDACRSEHCSSPPAGCCRTAVDFQKWSTRTASGLDRPRLILA